MMVRPATDVTDVTGFSIYRPSRVCARVVRSTDKIGYIGYIRYGRFGPGGGLMSFGPYNRQARKTMAAKARECAAKVSRCMFDYDDSGCLVRIIDPRAQAVLCRAFERLLLAGDEPQLMRLSEAEAAAFPRGGSRPAPGATPWLAVGLDQVQSATFVLRWLDVSGLDPMGQRAMAQVALIAELPGDRPCVTCHPPSGSFSAHAYTGTVGVFVFLLHLVSRVQHRNKFCPVLQHERTGPLQAFDAGGWARALAQVMKPWVAPGNLT